jgi:hypothetical protein
MATTSQQAPVGARAQDESWGRPDTALLALTAVTRRRQASHRSGLGSHR